MTEGQKKFPFWLSFCAALGFLFLCALGVWQLQRLEWKQGLLSEIDTALSAEVTEWSSVQEFADIPAYSQAGAPFFKRVQIEANRFHQYEEGEILLKDVDGLRRGLDVVISPKTHQGRIGVHIYTPFTEGEYVLWVKQGWVEANKPFGGGNLYTAKQISGILKYPPRPNYFTPENNPDANEWFIANPKEMSDARGLDPDKTLHVILVRDDQDAASKVTIEPVTAGLRNDHAQYAMFWFVMAGALAIIYAIRINRA